MSGQTVFAKHITINNRVLSFTLHSLAIEEIKVQVILIGVD